MSRDSPRHYYSYIEFAPVLAASKAVRDRTPKCPSTAFTSRRDIKRMPNMGSAMAAANSEFLAILYG